jgi:hypothetical protein
MPVAFRSSAKGWKMTPQFKKAAHKNVQTERALVSARWRSSTDALMLRDRDRQRRFALNSVAPSCLLLIIRHTAEHAARFGLLTFFGFSDLRVESKLRCSLASVFKRRTTLNALIASASVFEHFGCFAADWSWVCQRYQ